MKVSSTEYPQFLASLKATIRERQYQALWAVNHELLALYYEIGEAIYRKQEDSGWGKAVVETLAHDLQAEFPGRNGFSAQNLWLMRQFYCEYQNFPKLQPLVAEISWAKNLVILARCKDPLQREFYLRAMARPFQHVCRISRFSTARRVFPQIPRSSRGPHSKMRFAEKGKMQPVENFHRFGKLKHCMLLPEAFNLTGNIEKYGSGFIRIRKALEDYPEVRLEISESGHGLMLSFLRVDLQPESQQVTDQVTDEVLRLLSVIRGPMSRSEIQAVLGLRHLPHLRVAYLNPAIEHGLLEMTIPSKPQSRLQKYRLTPAGKALAARKSRVMNSLK